MGQETEWNQQCGWGGQDGNTGDRVAFPQHQYCFRTPALSSIRFLHLPEMMPLQAFCIFRSERNSFLAFSLFCSAVLYQPLLQLNHSMIWFSVSLKLFFFPTLLAYLWSHNLVTKFFIFWSSVSITTSFKKKDEKNRVANTFIEAIHVFEMNELRNTSRLLILRNHYDASTTEDHTACFQNPHTRGSVSTSWAKKRKILLLRFLNLEDDTNSKSNNLYWRPMSQVLCWVLKIQIWIDFSLA